jgi:uncharacterized membrane protein
LNRENHFGWIEKTGTLAVKNIFKKVIEKTFPIIKTKIIIGKTFAIIHWVKIMIEKT